jgi:hypothetical protein
MPKRFSVLFQNKAELLEMGVVVVPNRICPWTKVAAPVPPFTTGTVPSVMAGVLVPVTMVIGEVAVTLVTVPDAPAAQDATVPLVVRTFPLYPV